MEVSSRKDSKKRNYEYVRLDRTCFKQTEFIKRKESTYSEEDVKDAIKTLEKRDKWKAEIEIRKVHR